MTSAAIRRTTQLLTALVAIVTLAGCGLLPGGGGKDSPTLEKTNLKVGWLPTIDAAPLQIAKQEQIFANAGLSVELVKLPSAEDGLRQLDTGTIDVALASYIAMIKAVSNGMDLEVQGEAYQAGRNSMALVTLPESGYRNPTSKTNPRIAVNSIGDIATVSSTVALEQAGVDKNKIDFIAMPFGDMPQALTSKQVDAAWMIEPYITKIRVSNGAQIVTDTAIGQTADFPLTGYVASRKMTQANRNTMKVFRRVLSEAQQHASDRMTVQGALPQYAEVDGMVAALVSVGGFPTTLDKERLQRVSELVQIQGLVPGKVDVAKMLPQGV
jgi:NitT/TauT family transport system substrate-binding protein